MQVFSSRNDYYFLILSGTLYDIERKYVYKIFLVGMTTTFLFSLVLYTTLRENKHIKSLLVKMTTTILFSFSHSIWHAQKPAYNLLFY